MDELLTIGQVADRVGVATSALRFYERRGLIASERTPGGQRRFHRDVLRRLAFIGAGQAVGISLAEIGDALERLPGGRTPTRADWSELGTWWQPRLEARIATLTRLQRKLDQCVGCGCLSLDTCALFNPGDAAAENGPGPRFLLHDDKPAPHA